MNEYAIMKQTQQLTEYKMNGGDFTECVGNHGQMGFCGVCEHSAECKQMKLDKQDMTEALTDGLQMLTDDDIEFLSETFKIAVKELLERKQADGRN